MLWTDFSEIKNLQAAVTGGLITQDAAELRARVDFEIQLAITAHRMPSLVEKKRWVSYCNFNALVEMLNAGLVVREDGAERVNYWKLNATPQVACSLVLSNLAQAADFRPRVEKWKKSLSPYDALSLIKCGIIGQDDVVKLKESWRKYVTPSTLRSVVELGCLTVEETNEDISLWGSAVSGKDREEIIRHFIKNHVKEGRLSIGQIICGKVRNVSATGAIIDFNGIYGYLHRDDMSWSRARHPSELLEVGQDVDVKILDVDAENAHISLGLKQLAEDPWKTVPQRFPVGTRVQGEVRNLAAYGAFVEIAPGIEGLLHISEFSWTKRVVRPSDMLSVGDEITVQILSVDVDSQKIALGIRQMQANPWDTVQDRYPVGSRVKGKVHNLTNYGAFIELEEGIDGMIHISDMSWTRKINQPSECLNKSDEVEAIVMSVDPKGQRIALSLKLAQQNPWPDAIAKYDVGMVVVGHVANISKDRVLVELEPGVDGVIHISEVSDNPVEIAKEVLNVGDEVKARVIKVDPATYRIGLSIRAL